MKRNVQTDTDDVICPHVQGWRSEVEWVRYDDDLVSSVSGKDIPREKYDDTSMIPTVLPTVILYPRYCICLFHVPRDG